jgi:hypothetical protein
MALSTINSDGPLQDVEQFRDSFVQYFLRYVENRRKARFLFRFGEEQCFSEGICVSTRFRESSKKISWFI